IRDKLVTGVQTCALPILVDERCPGDLAEPWEVQDAMRDAKASRHRGRRLDLAARGALAVIGRDRERDPAAVERELQRDAGIEPRSEERRVGKECRARWEA